ncbi:MAG TPA: hypothetical protein VL053_20515, partial [Arachidicoccus sp.]|nr:hypothetical protein [Arachidicoccus sp.]
MVKIKNILYLSLVSVLIASCSNTRYLQTGEKLYTGASIEVADNADISSTESKDIKEELNE